MAQTSTTNPADFANRRQVYFSRELFKALEFNLRTYQFATKKTLPANSGAGGSGMAIRFFRPRKAKTGGVRNLTEGSTSATLSEVGVGYVDASLNQRGDRSQITDIVKATDILDTVQLHVKTLGMDAALDFDTVCTMAIFADCTSDPKALAAGVGTKAQTTLFNSNNTYGKGYFERFAGVANTGNSGNDFTTFNALTVAQAKFTRLEHLRALTQLRTNDVRPDSGNTYPVICPPQVMFDIRQDGTLVNAMTQRDNAKLYKWEEFTLDGGSFIESTNPWQEKNTYGTFDTSGSGATANYGLIYFGGDAYGTVKLSNNVAGGDPAAPRIVILDQADKSDPFNQKIDVVWKAFYGAILILTSDTSDVPHVCGLRVKSSWV